MRRRFTVSAALALALALALGLLWPASVESQETCYLDITCDGWCPFNQELELELWMCCTNGTCVPPVTSLGCC